MKKSSLIIISTVLIIVATGMRTSAQTTANQMPIKAADAGPRQITNTQIKLPIKSGSAAATATHARLLTQTELRTMLPVKPGGSPGTGSGATPGSNRAIPGSHPGGVPGNPAGGQTGTQAAAGANVAPIKSSGTGGTPAGGPPAPTSQH